MERVALRIGVVCHGCTIGEGETPKRNFVPCVEVRSQSVGLYDTVEGRFYGNDGNGTFGAPDGTFCTVTSGKPYDDGLAATFQVQSEQEH